MSWSSAAGARSIASSAEGREDTRQPSPAQHLAEVSNHVDVKLEAEVGRDHVPAILRNADTWIAKRNRTKPPRGAAGPGREKTPRSLRLVHIEDDAAILEPHDSAKPFAADSREFGKAAVLDIHCGYNYRVTRRIHRQDGKRLRVRRMRNAPDMADPIGSGPRHVAFTATTAY